MGAPPPGITYIFITSIPPKEPAPALQNGNNFSEPIREFHCEIIIVFRGILLLQY
jgi:hypothetical protein